MKSVKSISNNGAFARKWKNNGTLVGCCHLSLKFPSRGQLREILRIAKPWLSWYDFSWFFSGKLMCQCTASFVIPGLALQASDVLPAIDRPKSCFSGKKVVDAMLCILLVL